MMRALAPAILLLIAALACEEPVHRCISGEVQRFGWLEKRTRAGQVYRDYVVVFEGGQEKAFDHDNPGPDPLAPETEFEIWYTVHTNVWYGTEIDSVVRADRDSGRPCR